MDRRYVYSKLGLKPTDHLPHEGMPARNIDGIPVYVKPKKGKVLERRVIAICSCGQHVPVSSFDRHQKHCQRIA